MAGEAPKDFFISYTQADESWAKWIDQELRQAGYSTVVQVWDFQAGHSFIRKMDEASVNCRYTIAVFSPAYFKSNYCLMEMDAALVQGNLLPVRVREFTVRGIAAPVAYIDLARKNIKEEEARRALWDGVRGTSLRPTSPAPFPGSPPASAPSPPLRFPGYPPPIWNVPHLRNPNFTGREELLESLRRAVTGGQSAALTQTFAGLGGVGKTQMALEYAYRHAPDYDLVWWVRSEAPAALSADYAALAGPLNLREKDAPQQEAAVAAVRQKLRQLKKWLLIFDNANAPQDLNAYLPQGGGGQIIITSRNRTAWGGLGRVVPVPVWDRKESVAFLLKRTGQEDEAAAGELARELGDLPLALEQAAAYMEACGQSLSGYLKLFRQHYQELLGQGRSSQDYPDTVATTWELSFQKVKKESPEAADLLNLCAFLAPDDIPRELLAQGAEHLPPRLAQAVTDPLALNAALAALRRYSLMEVGEDSLAVHRLVQAVVRDRLDNKAKNKWAAAAVEMVNTTLSRDVDTNVQIWPWYTRLLPHALAAGGHAEKFRVALPAAGRVLNQGGFYLQIRAEFVEARKAYEQALAISEALYGPNHREVAIRVNNLGSVLHDLGDLKGAKAHYERAMAIGFEAAYGPTDPNFAGYISNLGSVLQALGDLEGAKAHFEQALSLDEAAYGPNHPKVARDVNNLGGVLQALRDLQGAKSHYERALAIDERVYGPNHPIVAIRVNNLGDVLQDLGDLEKAKAYYERALSIDEAAYGPNHPNVAIGVNNLGSVLRDIGDLEGAKAHFKRALAIDEAAYGPNHPKVAIRMNNLGEVLLSMADLEGAKVCFQRALYGQNHLEVVTPVNNLGYVLWAMGNAEGAKSHFERALSIDEAVYGPNHPKVAFRAENLGVVLKALGDLEGAKAHFELALAFWRQFLGDDHPHTKIVEKKLASLDLPEK